MIDEYVKKYVNLLRKSSGHKEVEDIINRVYEDGFEDGANEGG